MLAVVGPTACGKTALAVEIALALDGEVISADSRQVYRGMDIGTGKDLAEYVRGKVSVPVHLVDIVDAGEKYNVFGYQRPYGSFIPSFLRNCHACECSGVSNSLQPHGL